MGSGFFVNNQQIVTNHHVVQNCRNIAVRGAIKPSLVNLQYYNEQHDIAVLKVQELGNSPNRIASLRQNTNTIETNDVIFSIGYPLEHGKTGLYLINKANITSIENQDGANSFQFTDTVDHGNSGGPLIDKSSNVIGVVTSRVTYSDQNNNQKSYGSAISIEWVMNFLRQNNVLYGVNYTYKDLIGIPMPTQAANDYVVNIHCIH